MKDEKHIKGDILKLKAKIEDMMFQLNEIKRSLDESDRLEVKAGDVVVNIIDEKIFLGQDNGIKIPDGREGYLGSNQLNEGELRVENLGKFEDVYVEKQKIIDILSMEDGDGDSLLGYIFGNNDLPYEEDLKKVTDALSELGIKPNQK